MASIHSSERKNTAWIVTALSCCFFSFFGCAYRLTNLHIQNPDNIHSIAIESIFDTGSQVIPHEQMWDQLQRAFAANGHLKVTSAKNADALLRAHIRTSEINKSGDLLDKNPTNIRKDPDIFEGNNPQPPSLSPTDGPLRDLTTASRVYSKDATTFVVDVEVWNLETRQLMLQRTYHGRTEALAIAPAQPDLAFIRHDEVTDRNMTTVAKQIAENVVSDLLVR